MTVTRALLIALAVLVIATIALSYGPGWCPKGAKKGDDMNEWPEGIRVREMPLLLAA